MLYPNIPVLLNSFPGILQGFQNLKKSGLVNDQNMKIFMDQAEDKTRFQQATWQVFDVTEEEAILMYLK